MRVNAGRGGPGSGAECGAILASWMTLPWSRGEQAGGDAGWRTAPDTGASRPQVRASRLDQGFPARRIPEVADSGRAARCHTPGMVPRSLMLRLTRETEHDVSRTVVDERYWLAHSDGFRVDGPAGRLGTVLRVIDGDQTLDNPDRHPGQPHRAGAL